MLEADKKQASALAYSYAKEVGAEVEVVNESYMQAIFESARREVDAVLKDTIKAQENRMSRTVWA